LSHLYIKTNILPRQARDKHRKNSKKERFTSGVDESDEEAPQTQQGLSDSEEEGESGSPANMAWDLGSRQLWLGVSRAPQRDASLGGVTGVAGGVEVVYMYEGWGFAVSILAAMQAQQQPLPPSPCPPWLEVREATAAAGHGGSAEDTQRRAADEAALAAALGLGFVTVDAESVSQAAAGGGGGAGMAQYDAWLSVRMLHTHTPLL